MGVLILALALSLALGALPSLAASTLDTWVEGKSIGRVRVGMPMSDAAIALRAFGEIEEEEDEDGKTICNPLTGTGYCVFDYNTYGSDGFEIVKTPGRVLSISTDDPRFKSNGLGVGSMGVLFSDRFGPADFAGSRWASWDSKGLGVLVNRYGIVSVLVIFKPR